MSKVKTSDTGYHVFTQQEAKEILAELNSEYPNMSNKPVTSNIRDKFFENHWMLVALAGVVVVSAVVQHERIGDQMARRLNNIF